MSLRVKVTGWRGEHETDLATYLRPRSASYESGGRIEDLRPDLDETQDAVGKLLALLVERRMLSLEEAANIAGRYDSAELIE